MRRTDIEDRWMKFGSIGELISLGDDVIAMASGVHVMFLNLSTREQSLERFDSAERGRGASCLAGHPVVPMFATAERRYHPKIFIFTYPTINRVSICSLEKNPNRYLSSAFAGTDYLLTLTDYPNFQIILWSWRTGEFLTAIETQIHDHDQLIACCPSSPYLVSQIGRKSGKLSVYEISVCVKIVSIAPVDYDTSSVGNNVSVSWMSDGNVVCCDDTGEVSLISNDGKQRFVIVRRENDNIASRGKPMLKSFRTGVILVNEKSQIHFYRKSTGDRVKSGSPWKPVWSIEAPSHPTCVIRCRQKDGLLFCGNRGEIFELTIDADERSPKLRVLFHMGSKYKFLTPINPLGSHVAAIDAHERLDILQCISGEVVANICLETYGKVRCVTSHPTRPIIAISSAAGKCVVLNLSRISEPLVTKIHHLQRESLNKIRYSFPAGILGVANTRLAKLFVISDTNDPENDVLGLINFSFEIVDFLIYETSSESAKILLLAKTFKNQACGQKIIVYSFDYSRNIEECERIIEMPNILDSLGYGRSKDEIIVVPYLTKQLHCIEIQENFRGLNLTEAISLGHQLRNIAVSVDTQFIVTCGYDGLVVVRSKMKIQKPLAIFMAHYRQEGGTKFAIFSGANKTFVSLGRNGDLSGTKICNLEVSVSVSESDQLAVVSHRSNESIIEDDVTWIERRLAMTLQEEREMCALERSSILKDFHNLRDRLKHLLDLNEIESADAKLPISDFDIDHESRSRQIRENIENQKNLECQLEEEIFQQDQVAKYLHESCWDSMELPASCLLSIHGETTVANFPMLRVTKAEQDCREAFEAEFKNSSGNNAKGVDELSERPVIIGTTTRRWIPEIPIELGNQFRKYSTYAEGQRLCTIIRGQERQLKAYFNELFEKMRAVKERELALAAERIDEIEHCSSELGDTFGIHRSKADDTLQPLWHYSEKPETIVTVTDYEIEAGQAVTFLPRDTHLEMMRKQEKERLKLNDEFREGALEVMMDGLLEVRWEDEIKKDLPKPLCLSCKDPSTYTEEEKAEVDAHSIKCQELELERQKYKRLLEDKILSVQESMRRDANAFDHKLEIFYLERMKIESAVLQEKLMRLRESQQHSSTRRGMEMMRLAQNELESVSKEFRNLVEMTTTLESVVNDTRNRYDNLTKRDKILESKFRGEFPDLKQPMVEHLLRQYRKRPRNVQLTCTSVTFLTEISRCLVNGEKSDILPRDCFQFLKAIDNLDVMPNNLPAPIDDSHWHLLCKLRRAKIELEVKIKSCAVDLAEAEQTLISHQKTCFNAETRLSQLKESIKERETQHMEALEDMEVQLVLKMGQIESRLCGNSTELSNAVLVPFRVVEQANNAIIEAGRKKIAAMRKTVEFRRTILWQEWRHKCMRVTLRDMKDELKVLQGVKVTREMQYYLQNHCSSIGMEKDTNYYEKISEITKQRFHKIVGKEKKRVIEANVNVGVWRKQNTRLVEAIEKTKLKSFKASMVAHDGTRERDARYRRTKLKAIMKRNTLTKKVQDNYGELLALQTQLELLRLKTYPTLRLKGLPKDKQTPNNTE